VAFVGVVGVVGGDWWERKKEEREADEIIGKREGHVGICPAGCSKHQLSVLLN
jgi:hypothetical protein